MDEQIKPESTTVVEEKPNTETVTPETKVTETPTDQLNTGMAAIAYIIFFIPLLTDAKNDPFVKFHTKQGAVVFGLSFVLWAVRSMMPWGMWWIFNLVGIAILALAIIGILNALNGKKVKLPYVGHWGDKLNF